MEAANQTYRQPAAWTSTRPCADRESAIHSVALGGVFSSWAAFRFQPGFSESRAIASSGSDLLQANTNSQPEPASDPPRVAKAPAWPSIGSVDYILRLRSNSGFSPWVVRIIKDKLVVFFSAQRWVGQLRRSYKRKKKKKKKKPGALLPNKDTLRQMESTSRNLSRPPRSTTTATVTQWPGCPWADGRHSTSLRSSSYDTEQERVVPWLPDRAPGRNLEGSTAGNSSARPTTPSGRRTYSQSETKQASLVETGRERTLDLPGYDGLPTEHCHKAAPQPDFQFVEGHDRSPLKTRSERGVLQLSAHLRQPGSPPINEQASAVVLR